jgi:hypothetical protein
MELEKDRVEKRGEKASPSTIYYTISLGVWWVNYLIIARPVA